MGNTKTTTGSSQNQQQQMTTTATPEERQMEQLELSGMQQTQPQQVQVQKSGLNAINNLLTGNLAALPNYMRQSATGIDNNAIATQAGVMTRKLLPNFQASGVPLDSGETLRSVTQQIANELLYPTQQFNIGASQNALNLALSGQAQVQAPVQANTNTLATQLAGLRQINQTGSTSGTQTTTTNPFLNSFYSADGNALAAWYNPNTYMRRG